MRKGLCLWVAALTVLSVGMLAAHDLWAVARVSQPNTPVTPGSGAASPAASDQLPVEIDGKMSSLLLLQAGRASSDELKACCPGASDGLSLVFLTKSSDDPVDFMMTAGVRTLIDRRTYPFDANGAEGLRPRIVARDVDDIFRLLPDLAGRVPASFKPFLALVITIPGDTLPESGQVDVTLGIGYHRKVEPLSVTFALPKKQAAK
jgi:hypothetical protein